MPNTLTEHLSLMLSNNTSDIREHLLEEPIDNLNDYECYACYSVAELCQPVEEYVSEYYDIAI